MASRIDRRPPNPTADAAAKWAIAHPHETLREIAERFGVTRESVSIRVRDAGVTKRGPYRQIVHDIPLQLIVERALREYWSTYRLGTELGVSGTRARNLMREYQQLLGPVARQKLTSLKSAAAAASLSWPLLLRLIEQRRIPTVLKGIVLYLDEDGLKLFQSAVAEFDDRRCAGCGGKLKNRRQTKWCSRACLNRRKREPTADIRASPGTVGPVNARILKRLASRRKTGRLVPFPEACRLAECSRGRIEYMRRRKILSVEPASGMRTAFLYYTGELKVVRAVLREQQRRESAAAARTASTD